jgi:hypothetical protein
MLAQVGKPTDDLLTVKLLINSIISTDGTKLMMMDIMDFYLNTPRPDTNTCASTLPTCQMMLSSTTTFAAKAPPMATSTAKSRRGCTAFYRQVSLLSNCSKIAKQPRSVET